MCGVAGFSAPGRGAAAELSAMLGALAHRGPDGSGRFIDAGIALAHNRLAVVDLEGGAQPRVDLATGDALSYNGEIYGFRAQAEALRRDGAALRDGSDTEVLFHLIQRHGVRGALGRIDGMFAFAYRDGRSGDLYLARDRFGEKPMFYGSRAGRIVFASEPGAILRHETFRGAAPDIAAAYQALQFEYLPGDASGWAGIVRLAPGSVLRFRDGRAATERYWRPRVGHGVAATEAEATDRLDALLQAAVQRQLVADVPVGVFLSGGLDSSLLTALAVREAPAITAFTVRAPGAGFDESAQAADVARCLGVRHEIVAVSDADMDDALDAMADKLSEPLADSSLLPTWLVCRAARSRMTVALGGDGADELFAGYPNFKAQRLAEAMRRLPRRAADWPARAARAVLPASGYMNLPFRLAQLGHGFGQPSARQSFHWMAPFGPDALTAIWSAGVAAGQREAAFAAVDEAAAEAGAGGLDRLLHQFLVTYLPHDILTKTDRAAMFNGLEVRSPFLDRPFAEAAAALPTSLKLRGRTGKYILKQVARRYLPARIVDRRKHGFAIPIGALLRGTARARCEDTLLSRRNPVADWFDRPVIEAMLREHMAGRRDHGKRLWALHVLFTVYDRPARATEPVAALAG